MLCREHSAPRGAPPHPSEKATSDPFGSEASGGWKTSAGITATDLKTSTAGPSVPSQPSSTWRREREQLQTPVPFGQYIVALDRRCSTGRDAGSGPSRSVGESARRHG